MDLKLLSKFYENLQDEESRILFSLKWEMLLGEKTHSDFMNTLRSLDYKWNIPSYDDCRDKIGDRKLIIFGAGVDGGMTYDVLSKNGIAVYAFCDNDLTKQGTVLYDKPILSVNEIKENADSYYVIIASSKYSGMLLNDLVSSYFPRDNIWYPRLGSLYATTGQQYFDCPGLNPIGSKEVFIDAGCFDADTSKQFAKWCTGKYKRIIAFEPNKCNYQKCKSNNYLKNFELLPYATWSQKEQVRFLNDSSSSRVSDSEEMILETESIDNVLKGEQATFIKLDVEGAEIETLKGAEDTIRKHKPRLAISIYHKPSDIYEIPELIMGYREDYKFYIRHYTNRTWETVLYAI